jgi:hypothetical protein
LSISKNYGTCGGGDKSVFGLVVVVSDVVVVTDFVFVLVVVVVTTDEVLCGEVVTLALDLLMSCAFSFIDISFYDPLSNLLRFARLLLRLWGFQIFVICRVLWNF